MIHNKEIYLRNGRGIYIQMEAKPKDTFEVY